MNKGTIYDAFRKFLMELPLFVTPIVITAALSLVVWWWDARNQNAELNAPLTPAETIALGAMIISVLSLLSNFVFSFRTDRRALGQPEDSSVVELTRRLELMEMELRTGRQIALLEQENQVLKGHASRTDQGRKLLKSLEDEI